MDSVGLPIGCPDCLNLTKSKAPTANGVSTVPRPVSIYCPGRIVPAWPGGYREDPPPKKKSLDPPLSSRLEGL